MSISSDFLLTQLTMQATQEKYATRATDAADASDATTTTRRPFLRCKRGVALFHGAGNREIIDFVTESCGRTHTLHLYTQPQFPS